MVPALDHMTQDGQRKAGKPVITSGGCVDHKEFSFGFQSSEPTLAVSSVVRRLPGTARRNNARAYFRSGLRPSFQLFGRLSDTAKSQIKLSGSVDLHAQQHGDIECPSLATQSTIKFGIGKEHQV